MSFRRGGRPAAGISCPCRGTSYFSLRAQREVTKRNGTPMARPPGIPGSSPGQALPSGCAGGWRGFPTAPPCAGGKLARIPAGHPADFPPPARRAIGAPGEAARSCAQKQEQQQEHPTPTLPCTQGRGIARACNLAVASAVVFASGAQEARLLFRGPWAAVRRGRQGRAAGEAMDGLAFSRGQEPARKARPRLTHLPGRRPGKRQPGWPSLLLRASCPPPFGPASPFTRVPDARVVTFLLATQEKSNSGARRAHETALNDTTPEFTP